MTWQEQLRKLDEDFSSGRISAEDYRVRRDQVLSSAVAPTQHGQAPASAEATQIVRPAGGQDSPDATQVVNPQQQANGGWGAQHAQQEEQLWGGDQFPPIAPPADDDWVTQGPEDGNGGKSKSKTPLIVGAVAALVLLIGLGIGALFLFGGEEEAAPPPDGGTSAPAQPPVEQTTEPPASEENDPLPLGELPGKVEDHPEIKSYSDVQKEGYLNEKELTAYNKAGAGDAKYQVQHLSKDSSAPVLLFAANSGEEAAGAVKSLQKIQIDNGAKKASKPPKRVLVTEYKGEKNMGQIRGHYVAGNVIVRIEVTNKKGLATARKDFDKMLQAQLDALPAT